ncbi:cellulose biosynthesis protein BcsE [Photobacterium halotolerans]|uniref:cellulose biosynthesis protein BcsE n=1 Tax=Photobacterium halotolerans TaxID=265726 RepID=UPI0006194379|nr:cellulose biosynthesis protein BcsE [Photobacterium halotolerans]
MSTNPDFTHFIEINNFPSLYVNLFDQKTLAIDYLKSIIKQNKNNQFTSFANKDNFYSGLNTEQGEQLASTLKEKCKRRLFLNRNKTKNGIHFHLLLDDILKLKGVKKSLVILFVPDIFFTHINKDNLTIVLNKLNAYATQHELSIQLLIYGSVTASSFTPALLSLNRHLTGLASMTMISDNKYSYQVHFWADPDGIQSDRRFVLQKTAQDALAEVQVSAPGMPAFSNPHDSTLIIMSQDVLDEDIPHPAHVQLAANNAAIIRDPQIPHAATVILSCQSPEAVRQLAADCLHLRQQAGPQLKIIIREVRQCLRYADETFLLLAGVNLIVPYHLPFLRMMSQVEAMQGQYMTRPLPDNTEELLFHDPNYHARGYLDNQTFIQYCHTVMQQFTSPRLGVVLIQLKLLSGMQPEECLRLCHIRRDGDVITACNHALYVLFSAIRQTDIQTALNHIFDVPVRDLFRAVHIITTPYELEQELEVIDKEALPVSAEIKKITTEPAIFAATGNRQPEAAALFATPKPIRFKGES